MKRIVGLLSVVAVVTLLATAAFAFMGPGNMGMGMMGMHGAGCPGMATGTPAAAIGEEKAKALAEAYATTYLPGYTVEKVLPFTGRHGTAYSVELKGPNAELRVLHRGGGGKAAARSGKTNPWRFGTA